MSAVTGIFREVFWLIRIGRKMEAPLFDKGSLIRLMSFESPKVLGSVPGDASKNPQMVGVMNQR